MDVRRILFITGPPRSGKSTLAKSLAAFYPEDAVTVLSTSALCYGNQGPWKELGAMFPDEYELAQRVSYALREITAPQVIIDGAPREDGQFGWAHRAGTSFSAVVLRSQPPVKLMTTADQARSARWYSVQVHDLAKRLRSVRHWLGPDPGWPDAGLVRAFWEGSNERAMS